jgi:hypothetical protein
MDDVRMVRGVHIIDSTGRQQVCMGDVYWMRRIESESLQDSRRHIVYMDTYIRTLTTTLCQAF